MKPKQSNSDGFMYLDTGGNGPVVVLLHGVLMNGSLWNEVVDGMPNHYRCIVPELPFGAHSTPMPDDANLDLESIAAMLGEFLVELDLHEVTLVCKRLGRRTARHQTRGVRPCRKPCTRLLRQPSIITRRAYPVGFSASAHPYQAAPT